MGPMASSGRGGPLAGWKRGTGRLTGQGVVLLGPGLGRMAPLSTCPAFAPTLRLGSDLNLWVQDPGRPGDLRSSWSVFSTAGELLGLVETPPAFDVLEIGPD